MTPSSTKTLKNVVNFVKPALHVNKSCYISLTNIHSFVLQMKHCHWSSQHSCLGNCLVWKISMGEKTFTLQGWTQMVIFRLFVLNTCKCLPSNCLVPVPEFEISTWALIDHFIVVCSMTWPLNDSKAAADLVLIRTSLLLLCKSSS